MLKLDKQKPKGISKIAKSSKFGRNRNSPQKINFMRFSCNNYTNILTSMPKLSYYAKNRIIYSLKYARAR